LLLSQLFFLEDSPPWFRKFYFLKKWNMNIKLKIMKKMQKKGKGSPNLIK